MSVETTLSINDHDESTLVQIEQGQLRGKILNSVKGVLYFGYKGIPYAKPPIGELRFKPPAEPDPWEGILDAYEEGNRSLSISSTDDECVGDEDCLYLNVFTKELPKSGESLKPVMFWIHGGGYIRGSGNTDLHGPDYLIAEDIVLVTCNYRLGLQGCLYVKDPRAGCSGNNLLKDKIMALKWVQKNIHAFNGDPNNVTVFGESAGAISAHNLLFSPMAKGLFHKMICQSGTAFDGQNYLENLPIIAAEAGGYKCDNELDAYNYLRNLPGPKLWEIFKLLDTYAIGKYDRVVSSITEFPDGNEPKCLTETPEVLCTRGDFIKVPLLIGTNTCDGMVYTSKDYLDKLLPLNFTDPELLVPRFMNIPKGTPQSLEIGKRIMKYYYGNETPSRRNAEKFAKYQTDVRYTLLTKKAVKYHLKFSNEPVYLYKFTMDSSCNLYKKVFNLTLPGVCHGDELTYLFYTKYHSRIRFGIAEENTVERLCKYWTNFARTGNPNPPETGSSPVFNVEWKPVESDVYNHLNIGKVLRAINYEPDKNRMDFWNQLFKDYNFFAMGVQTISNDDSTLIRIEQGQLRGKVLSSARDVLYFSYKGIPYAKPPIGELRFKCPVDPEPWDGILDAFVEGNRSLSISTTSDEIIGDEDCLYLNVFTRELPKNGVSLKPVMFWIHGGGFIRGSGNTDLHGPDFLIAEDVVLVTCNFRLGLQGCMYVRNSQAGCSGNNMLKDVIMALKWVQKNISAFNGDPNNVTVFGESAGAVSTHSLLFSSMAKGLFHKMICQSGTAFDNQVLENLAIIAAEADGYECKTELEAFNYLKDLPGSKLMDIWKLLNQYAVGKYDRVLGPIVESSEGDDPKFLLGKPELLCTKGEFIKVPLLIGTNSCDGMVHTTNDYLDKLLPLNFTDPELLVPRFMNIPKGTPQSLEIGQRIMKYYYGNETPSRRNAEKFAKYQTDVRYVLLSKKAIKYHLKFGKEPVYLYKFSLDSPCNLYKQIFNLTLPGVCHGDELTYLFYTKYHPRLRFGIAEENTVKRLCKFWTNFARTGNPNPPETGSSPLFKVEWKPVEPDVFNHLNIGKVVRAVNYEPDKESMEFWKQLFNDYNFEL
ncbi:neuroligin-3-like [Chrysoperla carnea]|uniref:neuroligin-3-like n=1 Tax=Chrysoperla carnea TaxID=189513 RepID=UPI001D0784E0|nr:neuroligin-3-like [Chrysoperla carnea]